MSAVLKAIETYYKGYRFRSRLEARWAVFFDALGMRWEYEPQGFELPGGIRYLPDFRITSPQGMVRWYEIKPAGTASDPKMDAFRRALLAEHDRLEQREDSYDKAASNSIGYVTLLSGDPVDWVEGIKKDPDGSWQGGCCPRCGDLDHWFAYGVWRNDEVAHVGCQPCDFDTPGGSGNDAEPGLLAYTEPYKGSLIVLGDFDAIEARVRNAALRARSARFEHGEGMR